MLCFISIMCTYNAQPIIALLLLYFNLWIHMNLYKKNLLFRSHPRSPVYATAVSLVLIGRMRTTCRPKPCPSPLPTPYLSQVPDQGHQENRGGEGEESLLVISCLRRSNRILSRCWSITHARCPCHIWWVTPLWGEHPCWSPRAKDVPASTTTELGGGGGAKERRRILMGGGGGWAGKRMCFVWNTSSLRKNSQGRYTWILPTFLFE